MIEARKKTMTEMLNVASINYGNSTYLCDKGDNEYIDKGFVDIKRDAEYFAAGLLKLGFLKKHKIAILSEGRSAWVATEFGIVKCGCVSVPLSPQLLSDEILFRVQHSESKAIICSLNTFAKVASIWDKLNKDSLRIIYLDNDLDKIKDDCEKYGINIGEDILLYENMLKEGMQILDKYQYRLNVIEHETTENDIINICYTSGTSGNPKGIMLTHLNYYTNATDSLNFFNLSKGDRLFVILPLDHSFAHTICIYLPLFCGFINYFVDARGGRMAALKNISINLKEVNPHLMLTVPAISGSFMIKINDAIKAKGGFVKWLFDKGLSAGIAINGDGYKKAGIITKLLKTPIYKLASTLVFSKVKQIFGDSMRFCVGGGALLDVKQQRFFYSLGVPIYQGYGLTEAAPIISANTPDQHKLGTSGKVFLSLKCKIVDSEENELPKGNKGELVIKGGNVMAGYFKNEQATREVIKDDWLYTRDLGYIDKDNFLVVVGREKALLISQDGEKYSPEEIEEAITNCSDLILQIMIYNDHKKITTALITLDRSKVEKLIEANHISSANELLEIIKESLYRFKNEGEFKGKFPEKWIPASFRIIEEPFSLENKMINSTMKMVRYKITEHYTDVIDEMYVADAMKSGKEKNIEILNRMFFVKLSEH